MTIVHPKRNMPDGAFVFAALGGFTCSICAPDDMSKADVEAFAEREVTGGVGGWEAVDKSKAGFGAATPNPCNIAAGRTHWFLLDSMTAATLGYATKK
jgi:hypothetical protein